MSAVKTPILLPNGAARVRICIDSAQNAELQGRWYHICRAGAQGFENVVQLLSGLERCFNRLCFPQSAMALRRLEPPGRARGAGSTQRKEGAQLMSAEQIDRQQGKKATFIVQIQFRQNATWQGTVTWAEKNETSHFRSALELLKMMDESIAAGEEEKSVSDWQ